MQSAGGYIIVENPDLSFGGKEGVIKNIVEDTLMDDSTITDCIVGSRYSIVELDNIKGIKAATLEHDNIVTTFTETTSISLSGDMLPSFDKLQTACYSVNLHLDCVFNNATSITITGSWNHIAEARKRIELLIMETISVDTTRGIVYLPADVTPALVDTKSSHLLESSTCSESINVSSHVIKMMKHKHPNLGPGITHTNGSKQVHFRFDNERELDAAIDKFQEESNALEEILQVDRINVPQGVHKDEMFGLIVSQLEGIYKDTVITWIDGEIEIEIISTCLMEVKEDLQRLMADRIPDEKVIEKNPTGGSWTSGLKKTFGSMFSSTPKIEYREKIELIFPNGRSLLLHHGNILDEHVDILVNPANAFLSHGAGLAKQIDKASNGAVGYYSKLVLPKIGGRVPTGGIVTTDAGNGNLHCSHVIHAVGPSANDHTDQECIKLLRKTVHAILKEGFKLGCRSMAIPAISSGIFGMKKQDVAEVIIHILADHQQINQDLHGILMDIRVVVWDRETYEPFMIVAQQVENTLKRH